MTRDDVIRMAREAGSLPCFVSGDIHWYTFTDEMLEKFALLLSSAEREACAKVCEMQFEHFDGTKENCFGSPFDCAAAIRARNQSAEAGGGK